MQKPLKITLILLAVLGSVAGGFLLYRHWFVAEFEVLNVDKVRTVVKVRLNGKEYEFSYLKGSSAVLMQAGPGKLISWTLDAQKLTDIPGFHFSVRRNGKLVRTENIRFI